jgi:teichuronic acid biosynthesis glycosyltransferase TuaG
MTTFSVIIPVYNAGAYIGRSLHSVFAQTCQDFEVIVVDDGSTDNTAEVVREFSSRPQLRYIGQANAGPAAARNRGINEAIGDYIAFLDADDLWHPQKLAAHLAYLRASPKMGMSFNWFEVFYDRPDGKHRKPWFSPPSKAKLYWANFLVRNWTGTSSTVVVRSECMVDKRFDARFRTGEDYYLWLKIAQEGWEIGFVPQVLTVYRKRPSSLTVDYLQIALDELYVMEELIVSCDPSERKALERAVTRRRVDVAWAYFKTGEYQAALESLQKDKGYSAIPQFMAERLTRKWLHRSLNY